MNKFTLPELPYGFGALEPAIDARTMEVHYTKHHQGYLNKLNAALESQSELFEKDIADILRDLSAVNDDIRAAVKNNGGGYYHHSLFWEMMAPAGSTKISDVVSKTLSDTFGDMDTFRDEFSKKAGSLFGSGWTWLARKDGALEIITTPNQDSPISSGYEPMLGLDVWEHAYYLHYQNRRADYIKAWWDVVNWDTVAKRLEA